MTLFPFFEDIDGKRLVIIGGGKVAKGKYERLRQFTENITVIANESDIDGYVKKEFEEKDLDNADCVIAATDNTELNEKIYFLCRQKNIPVNTVDNPDLCTFIFPSLIKRGDLTIGIATGGKSPLISKYIRQEIESILPDNIEGIIDEMSELREKLKNEIPDQAQRSRILKEKLAELIK